MAKRNDLALACVQQVKSGWKISDTKLVLEGLIIGRYLLREHHASGHINDLDQTIPIGTRV